MHANSGDGRGPARAAGNLGYPDHGPDGLEGRLGPRPGEGEHSSSGAGTYRVADIFQGAASSNPSSLVCLDGLGEAGPGGGGGNSTNASFPAGLLLFAADDGVHGRELWRSVGGGAVLVKDIRPGLYGSNPSYLTAYKVA